MDTMLKSGLRAVAMPASEAERIRARMADDYGNVLVAEAPEDPGPCRVCLTYSRPGERLILFSYRPFVEPAPYQEVGPVFIHADGCERYAGDSPIPPDFETRPLILRPYTAHNAIADSQVVAPAGRAAEIALEMLGQPGVAYVHVRSVSRGCYLFRIERT
jgi:hypothetical protein